MSRTPIFQQTARQFQFIRPSFTRNIMGKKKSNKDYNDFLEDTRPRDNNEIRTTLQTTSTLTRNIAHHPSASKPRPQHHTSRTKKPPLTHFLCLSLISEANRTHLSTALSQLRRDVETLTPVPAKAVRPVSSLHLTLGVMSLSASELSAAMKHLQELDVGQLLRGITTQKIAEEAHDTPMVSEGFGAVANPDFNPTDPAISSDLDGLVVTLEGLVPMQKAVQSSILYAEPQDKSGRLVRFAESVRKSFEDGGWVLKEDRGLKLHATVLNTIYAKPKARERSKRIENPTESKAITQQDRMEGDGEVAPDDGINGEHEQDKRSEREERSAGHGPDAKSWMRFDASPLIEVYKDFVWAEGVRIDRVQICKMGAQKILHEGTGEIVDEKYEVVSEKRL